MPVFYCKINITAFAFADTIIRDQLLEVIKLKREEPLINDPLAGKV